MPLEEMKVPRSGRPKKEFKQEQFENLCRIQCTKQEIMSVLDMCEKTLDLKINEMYGDNFSGVYERFKEEGRMSLRRQMMKNAIENNSIMMQIFLSKNYLGMAERQEVKSDQNVTFGENMDLERIKKICKDVSTEPTAEPEPESPDS